MPAPGYIDENDLFYTSYVLNLKLFVQFNVIYADYDDNKFDSFSLLFYLLISGKSFHSMLNTLCTTQKIMHDNICNLRLNSCFAPVYYSQ